MPDKAKLKAANQAIEDLGHEYYKFKKKHGYDGFPVLTRNIDQVKTLAFDLLQIAEAEEDLKTYPNDKYPKQQRLEARIKEFLEYY